MILAPRAAIHGLGVIGQQHQGSLEIIEYLLEVAQVGWRDHVRKKVDQALLFAFLGQGFDGCPYGGMKAIDVAALVAWRRGMNQNRHWCAVLELLLILTQNSGHIIADGLAQAGGRYSDDLGLILIGDVFQSDFQVMAAAEHGTLFMEV